MEIKKTLERLEGKEAAVCLLGGEEYRGVIERVTENGFFIDETTALGDMGFFSYDAVESALEVKELQYLGMDSWDRPVYQDKKGTMWKDTDPRSHVPASLYSAHNNAFDGEPDVPFHGVPVFLPKRKTW